MKRILSVVLTIIMLFSMGLTTAGAHSGRTDGRGGHKDNKNKSGLGSYHYHCGGNPPHLHTNGCPYKSGSSSSSSKSATKAPAKPKSTPKPAVRYP